MLLRSKATGISSLAKPSTGGGSGGSDAAGWEVRPGGMLVQKRNSDQNAVPIPKIKVKVKHGSSDHEVNINPQASFGKLKKMLAGPTGLQPQDQKLMYRDKDRNSKAFLDVAGVNDGAKIVLVEDVMSRERRVPESRKNGEIDTASKAIAEIGLEVDRLGKQVGALESEIYGGKNVAETLVLNLIELLMTQLLKLDEIVADRDAKLQRREQVRRVQKYIETLDMLKIKNASNEVEASLQQKQKHSTWQMSKPVQKQQEQRNSTVRMLGLAAVTPKRETFHSGVAAPSPFTSSSGEDNFKFPFPFGNPPSKFPFGKIPVQFPYGKPPEFD